MGEFHRQPSKVWWSTYDREDLHQSSEFLNWGKSVDLSVDLSDADLPCSNSYVKNNEHSVKKNESSSNTSTAAYLEQRNNNFKNEEEAEENKSQRDNIQCVRGSSSSPSSGSHKSQDSGFSDSEIQNNANSLSPVSSPELSVRANRVQYKSKEESKNLQNDVNDNTTTKFCLNSPKLSKNIQPERKERKYLETALDDSIKTPRKENSTKDDTKEEKKLNFAKANVVPNLTSPKQKNRKNLIKTQILRTKYDTREKINQIQNQLELSFKLAKKINLSHNIKIFSSQIKCWEQPVSQKTIKNTKNSSTDSSTVVKPIPCRSHNETVVKQEQNDTNSVNNNQKKLSCEEFRVSKLPSECSFESKSNSHNNLLDLTDIDGPPISCSTPKSGKFQFKECSLPRTARGNESKLPSKSTFATIRKLKGVQDKKLKKPTNLLSNHSRCEKTESKSVVDTDSSVKLWLLEMKIMYEAEVMTTLQSKSLATDLTRQVTNMADTTSQIVRKLHQKTKIISSEFSKFCQQNKTREAKQIVPIVKNLVGHITDFVNEYVKQNKLMPQISFLPEKQRLRDKKETENSNEMITDFRQAEPETVEIVERSTNNSKLESVLESCEKLFQLVTKNQLDHEKIEAEVSDLGQKFTEVVDILLESHIQALVHVLEEPRTELALRTALSALITLGLENNQLSHLVAKCGGIRALLAVCLEARATAVRVSALRSLATVCCTSETIHQFEKAGGVEIVAEILADENRLEAELSEASAVIAQITAPWVQDNHSLDGLNQFLSNLVTSLTRIVNRFRSSETLLLSSAALANLTFMEPRTVWPLLKNDTIKILLMAVRQQGPKVSVFIQEQAATIIANMASVPECRKHLAEHRAVVALLCFLEIHHSPFQRVAEMAAAERVQQKSAIALSRLCSDAMVAKQVIELQGVNRLVRLCKEEKERNHSDGVLVACLAALRKIVANCGKKALEDLNAMELVEPRLLDSFLLYSSKQESYV